MQHRLGALFGSRAPRFSIVTDTPHLLPQHAPSVRRRIGRVLVARDVVAAPRRARGRRRARRGASSPTAGASPPSASSGPRRRRRSRGSPPPDLACDARGFMRLDEYLRSVSHPFVFGAGDCAAQDAHPRPKSGVYAVRQGPPLADQPAPRRAGRGAAGVRAAARGAGADLDRRPSRHRLARRVRGRGRLGVALEGPHRPRHSWRSTAIRPRSARIPAMNPRSRRRCRFSPPSSSCWHCALSVAFRRARPGRHRADPEAGRAADVVLPGRSRDGQHAEQGLHVQRRLRRHRRRRRGVRRAGHAGARPGDARRDPQDHAAAGEARDRQPLPRRPLLRAGGVQGRRGRDLGAAPGAGLPQLGPGERPAGAAPARPLPLGRRQDPHRHPRRLARRRHRLPARRRSRSGCSTPKARIRPRT